MERRERTSGQREGEWEREKKREMKKGLWPHLQKNWDSNDVTRRSAGAIFWLLHYIVSQWDDSQPRKKKERKILVSLFSFSIFFSLPFLHWIPCKVQNSARMRFFLVKSNESKTQGVKGERGGKREKRGRENEEEEKLKNRTRRKERKREREAATFWGDGTLKYKRLHALNSSQEEPKEEERKNRTSMTTKQSARDTKKRREKLGREREREWSERKWKTDKHKKEERERILPENNNDEKKAPRPCFSDVNGGEGREKKKQFKDHFSIA